MWGVLYTGVDNIIHPEQVESASEARYYVLKVMQKFGAFSLHYSDVLGWRICPKIMNHIEY